MTNNKPLTRDEVRSAIKGCSIASRVPFYIHFWVHGNTFGEREPRVRALLDSYPVDIQLVPFNMPAKFKENEDATGYCWLPYTDPNKDKELAYDAVMPMPEWDKLDTVLDEFPKPNFPNLFRYAKPTDGRYRLAQWFYCLFERHWELRGMTNALVDYYEHPKEVHRLFRALTNFYVGIIERAAREQQCDGIWTSDDVGTQTGPFFSREIFREFFKPYYAELIDCAHAHGMEFWMHACGNVELFIPDWIDAGLDVLHPIQKYAMNEKKTAAEFGDALTIMAGLDVQRIIPWGTPEEVRAEVRFLLDTFWKAGVGHCILSAGNGINQDCPLESLEAFLDEALKYGTSIVRDKRRNYSTGRTNK